MERSPLINIEPFDDPLSFAPKPTSPQDEALFIARVKAERNGYTSWACEFITTSDRVLTVAPSDEQRDRIVDILSRMGQPGASAESIAVQWIAHRLEMLSPYYGFGFSYETATIQAMALMDFSLVSSMANAPSPMATVSKVVNNVVSCFIEEYLAGQS